MSLIHVTNYEKTPESEKILNRFKVTRDSQKKSSRRKTMNEKNTSAIFNKATSILARHGAKRVSVFGSYARGEQTPESDLDIIVEFFERKSLLDIVGIELELCDELGIKVDLLTEKSISPYLIDRIKKEMMLIYG